MWCRDAFPAATSSSRTLYRKRQIGQPAAMQMAELAPAVAKLDTAEPVRSDGDTGPAGHLPDDLVFDALGHVRRRYQYPPAGLASIRLAHLRVHSADPCISGDDANCASALDPFRS